ncbi:MAG: 5'-methylthioinosine phosphorylase [Oceanicoccus sp.]|jgi:5'-methylthioinosine phosphorylase
MRDSNKVLAIIGGTGLNNFQEGNTDRETSTPFGHISTPMIQSTKNGVPLVFLARHGSPHTLPPDRINYRANMWALKNKGVTHVIAVNAVGGIHRDLPAGTVVIPDQIVDYSYGREHTFFDGVTYPGVTNDLTHIDFTFPFNEGLRSCLIKSAKNCHIDIAETATYAVTQGPRLETAAEINRFEIEGCAIVGMTAMPEAALARELGLDYASICLVVNPAAGRSDSLISMDDIRKVIDDGMIKVRKILEEAVSLL